MKRLSFALLVLIALPMFAAAKDEGVAVEVANASTHEAAPRVIALDAKVGAKFAVEGPDGKQVPSWHDKASGKVLVLASVPAGGGTFTVRDGVNSRASHPKWGKTKTKSEGRLDIGKVITRVSGSFENDLLQVSVPVDEQVHGRLQIKARKGGYKLQLSPLGASVGNIEREEIAQDIEAAMARGERSHKEIFAAYPSIATKVEFIDPNPFQRVMRVQCADWARKNSGDVLDLFTSCGYEVTLTWGSPVVSVRSWRKQAKTYWNHNGVNLNEIHIDAVPLEMQCDDEAAATSRQLLGNVLDIKFEAAMRFKDKTGETIIHQPDFKRIGIYKPCVVLAKDRIMTVISQSWHEGWKPIEIKAGDYEDTMTIVCDAGRIDKPLQAWLTEWAPPSAETQE